MSPKKMFRTSLFGFNKQDVYAYLDDYVKEAEAKLEKKDKELVEVIGINKSLNADYAALRNRLETYESERDRVAGIILQSQEVAEVIIERAQKQAVARQAEIEEKIEFETAKLQALRDEMDRLVSIANQTTSYMKNELETVQTQEAKTSGESNS